MSLVWIVAGGVSAALPVAWQMLGYAEGLTGDDDAFWAELAALPVMRPCPQVSDATASGVGGPVRHVWRGGRHEAVPR